MSNIHKLLVIILLIVGSAGLFWSLNSASPTVFVSDVRAVKVTDSMYTVYLNMRNDGEPDIITDINAGKGINAFVMGADQTAGIVLPKGSKPSFSSDGAHIMINAENTEYESGEFIPLTLVFKNSKSQQIKAIVEIPDASSDKSMMMDHSMHHAGATMEINPELAAPAIEMQVSQNADKTWSVRLKTQNFEFYEPETEPLEHKDGQGHGHLYLNGLKLQRMYTDKATIGELPSGKHVISVTLNSNDHQAFTVEGVPLSAEANIEIE